MKTNTMISSTSPSDSHLPSAGAFRLASTGRLLLATACVSLASFTTIPSAHAAGANGRYDVKSVSGSLRFDGDKVDIPRKLIKRIAGVADGDITIRNNTLRLKKKGTVEVIENVADELNLEVEASVRGPSSVTLEKESRKNYSGHSAGAIVTAFDADAFGEDFSGKLKTRVSATVRGSTLTVVVRFSGSVEGEDFGGKVTIVAKR